MRRPPRKSQRFSTSKRSMELYQHPLKLVQPQSAQAMIIVTSTGHPGLILVALALSVPRIWVCWPHVKAHQRVHGEQFLKDNLIKSEFHKVQPSEDGNTKRTLLSDLRYIKLDPINGENVDN